MNWADQEYAIGRGVAAIRHKHVSELQPFLRAVVEYYLPDLLAQATGSTFPNVSAEQLARIPYPQIPEPEQRAIARILGTLDDKIELNRRMNETLEAMARAIFKSWFVDFDPVRAKADGREPAGMDAETAALFPDSFEETELRMVPKGWKVGTVEELCLSIENGSCMSVTDNIYIHGV
jgi:type I restriction enzyme S subunit